MKRLDDTTAKRLLEFLIARSLKNCNVNVEFDDLPNSSNFVIVANIEFADGKGCSVALCAKNFKSFLLSPIRSNSTSWSKTLKSLFDYAQQGTSFGVLNRIVIHAGQTLEEALVSMDLAYDEK